MALNKIQAQKVKTVVKKVEVLPIKLSKKIEVVPINLKKIINKDLNKDLPMSPALEYR